MEAREHFALGSCCDKRFQIVKLFYSCQSNIVIRTAFNSERPLPHCWQHDVERQDLRNAFRQSQSSQAGLC